jgi:opacity protein-like surface antigen
MRIRRGCLACAVIVCVLIARAASAQTPSQTGESRWVVDLGFGMAPSINGNVNSGAIGTLNGLATAVLPQSYGNVYGTGIDFRFGGGYVWDDVTEFHGMFTYQSADADLVRLGDYGPSSLYAQYSDYKTLGLDLTYRRYFPIPHQIVRPYAEGGIGIGFISRINVQFAAPQSNAIFTSTDFYDRTAAFTWTLNAGAMFRVAEHVDLNAQFGVRHVGGLAQVDQLVGTGLETINDNSARLTFPIVVGVRFRF